MSVLVVLVLTGKQSCIQVSQDRHQIFLIFGECGDAYLKYLKGEQIPTNNSSPDSFLIRHELGPWSVGNKNHMRHLGPILLAIALRADADVKEEEAAST